MAELNEQQAQSVSEKPKIHKSRSGFWFAIIILIVIFSIAGIGFYFFLQLRAQQDDLGGEVNKGDMQLIELSKQISGYQAQLAAIQSQLATVEADVAGKEAHFSKSLEEFSKLHNERLDNTRGEFSDTITQLQRQLGKTRGDWMIADAEYLLSIANQRLHLIGDVNTTREALEAADQRLRESGDAGTIKIREQIAKELAALRNVPEADIVGLFASIQSLQDQVDDLTLLLPYTGKAPAQEKKQNDQTDKEADNLLDSALGQLEGMVTIKHTDQPIKEILTPEEAQFIREQLRVKLELVKISLVQQNEQLYQSGLADAKKWTVKNFSKDEKAGKFIGELERFSSVKIRSHFPDISLSLKMLKDITKLRLDADKSVAPIEKNKPPHVQKPVEAIKPSSVGSEAVKPKENAPVPLNSVGSRSDGQEQENKPVQDKVTE